MLAIDFLKKDIPLQFSVAGLEFMDAARQRNVYETLTAFMQDKVKEKEVLPDVFMETFDWGRAEKQELSELIMRETGINVNIVEGGEYVPFAIESGFFSPNHILNNKGLDGALEAKYTSVSQAMKVIKTDVLKGWVDPKTGRVGGDFSKIPFEMYIGWIPGVILEKKVLEKYNVSMAQASAMAILHELGHAFSSFYFMMRQTVDICMASITSRLIAEADTQRRKVELYKEFAKELEIAGKIDETAIGQMDDQGNTVLFLNKMIANRNIRSTLSLGVADRSSEVYADIYAMKMGCPEHMVALINAIYSDKIPRWVGPAMVLVPFILLPTLGLVTLGISMVSFFWGSVFMFLDMSTFVPNDVYDSPYRRAKAILREYAGEISAAKQLPGNDRKIMLEKAQRMEKMVEEMKDYLEGTWVQRLGGWMTAGSDFKASEFEHYTQEVLNHNLSLYTEYFKKD